MDLKERIVNVIRKGKKQKQLPQKDGYKIVHNKSGQPSYVKMLPDEIRKIKKRNKKSAKKRKTKSTAKANKSRLKSIVKRARLGL